VIPAFLNADDEDWEPMFELCSHIIETRSGEKVAVWRHFNIEKETIGGQEMLGLRCHSTTEYENSLLIPYGGKFIGATTSADKTYVLGANDANPALDDTGIHGAWLGSYVNSSEEANCRFIEFNDEEGAQMTAALRANGEMECFEFDPRVCVETTRVIEKGEWLHTYYGFDSKGEFTEPEVLDDEVMVIEEEEELTEPIVGVAEATEADDIAGPMEVEPCVSEPLPVVVSDPLIVVSDPLTMLACYASDSD
jgi:hypothetical protein